MTSSTQASNHAIIYKPHQHADEYIVFIEDTKEVSPGITMILCLVTTKVFEHLRYRCISLNPFILNHIV